MWVIQFFTSEELNENSLNIDENASLNAASQFSCAALFGWFSRDFSLNSSLSTILVFRSCNNR